MAIGEINFESDDEIYKIKEEQEAVVQVRAEKDRELGDFKSGESQYGQWVAVPFEVVEGEHKGTWCSLMMTVDTKNRGFRKVFELVTGVDVSQGGTVSFDEFVDKICSGVYRAVIGPDKKNPQYVRVVSLEEQVGTREDAPEAATTVPGEDDVEDDDAPF